MNRIVCWTLWGLAPAGIAATLIASEAVRSSVAIGAIQIVLAVLP